MKTAFMREKVIRCGSDFIAPQVYPYTEGQQRASRRGKRAKKEKVSAPKQKNLNDKRAKRYFIMLANANFGAGDVAVHLDYAPQFLPETTEAAIKIAVKYLRRVAALRKKRGLPPLKYLLVTQVGRKKDGTHRLHHHILMNGGISRDELEELWWAVKKTKKHEAVLYGWANADRLRPNKKGIANMAGYIVQDHNGAKHWTQSQNLVKPWFKGTNDNKYSRRQIEQVAKMPMDCEEFKAFWEKQYEGRAGHNWELVDCERNYAEQSGWYFYLTMRRRD